MAVELLLLANDGPEGRKAGTVVNIKECPDGSSPSWGAKERPPWYRIVHIEGVMKADLDSRWLEFGCHESRVVFDFGRLPEKARNALAERGVVSLILSRVAAVAIDRGVGWMTQE